MNTATEIAEPETEVADETAVAAETPETDVVELPPEELHAQAVRQSQRAASGDGLLGAFKRL